jgi:hypothetical protein
MSFQAGLLEEELTNKFQELVNMSGREIQWERMSFWEN